MIRELRHADLGELADICRKGMEFEPVWTEALVEEKTFGAEDFQPELALGFEVDGRVRGFAMAVAREWRGERRGWIRLLVVNPAWRNQGIGGALLEEAEARLRREHITRIGIMDSVPNYLTPGVDFRYTAASCFLPKHGYERVGQNLNLRCDLAANDFSDCDGKIVELARSGFEIKRAEPSDREATVAHLRAEFPAWEFEVLNCFDNDPVSLWICYHEGRIVGFAAHDGTNRGTGHFGPTGVQPVTRGRGVGGLLTRLALRDIKRQGHRYATIPWVGPIRFYSKVCNSWTDRVFWTYEKRLDKTA